MLSDAPSNFSRLAEALHVAPSTTLRMVDRLVSPGLVERVQGSHDRRQTLLTRAGRRVVQRAVVALMTARQRDELTEAMSEFAESAEQFWGPRWV